MYGFVEDLRIEAGFPVRDEVDEIRVSTGDMQELRRNYSVNREKMWAADLNESGFLQDLELIGVGNFTRVDGDSLEEGWRPDVLIHSHPVKASARLSPYDKEMLLNRSHEQLSRGGDVEDLFSVSCILHRKWRFTEAGLFCYGNPFVYAGSGSWVSDEGRREVFIRGVASRGLVLNRVEVVEAG